MLEILILAFFIVAIFRVMSAQLLGHRLAETFLTRLAYELLRLPFRLARGVFRLASWSVRVPRLPQGRSR